MVILDPPMCVNYTRRGKYPYWRMIQLWHFNYAMKKLYCLRTLKRPITTTWILSKEQDRTAKCWTYDVNLSWSGSSCHHYEQQTSAFYPIKKVEGFQRNGNSRSLIPLCVNNKRLANTLNEWSKFSILNRHWRNYILQKAQTVIQTCLIP